MTQRLRGLWLVRVIASVCPPVGLASCVYGVVGIIGGAGIGYMLVVLGLVMIGLGITHIILLRALHGPTAASPDGQDCQRRSASDQ